MLAGGLGLSAGVMLYVSFMELMPEGARVLSGGDVTPRGSAYAALAFFAGIALIAVLDRLVPEAVSPHEFSGRMTGRHGHAELRDSEEQAADRALRARLLRTGTVTAIALAAHNV